MEFHGENIVKKFVRCLWKIPWNFMENSIEFQFYETEVEFNGIPWKIP
jgi:hypothetical protein